MEREKWDKKETSKKYRIETGKKSKKEENNVEEIVVEEGAEKLKLKDRRIKKAVELGIKNH